MKKILTILVVTLMLVSMLAGCSGGSGASGTFTMAGSTSMEKVAKAWAEAFTAKNPDATVNVEGGGSSAGITTVEDGTADIGLLSRELKAEEKAKGFKEEVVAIDGIAIIVNKANTQKELSLQQLADIYTGKITNWKQVGGADANIVVIGREAGSGTRDGFESIVKVAEKCKYKAELNETGQVLSTVASTNGAIGYVSLGYVNDTVHALAIDGVTPSESAVKDKTYKIQRPFIIVYKEDAKDGVKALAEFFLSKEGQQIVLDTKFVPVN